MTALWRRQVFPFGVISYGNREVAFTPAYLGDMADAFFAGACDVVPLTAEGDGGRFSGDPELIRGVVRSLEVVGDGLDALIEVDAETDALLEADRDRGTGARIIEGYKTTGREFPVVLAGVYFTRSPVLTGLRPWTREP